MPSKFRLRYLFKPLVNLIAKGLIRIRITPNVATIIMLCFSILSFFTLGFFRSLLYFSIFVFITGIMDGCDGAIARLTNSSTKFGGFFDSFMDRSSEFFIFLGLYFYTQNQYLWNFIDMKLIILISFSASIMISYTRARAEVFFRGDFDVGLMARSERLFYLVIISLISLFYNLFNFFLFIFMLLVLGTFVYRLINIYYKIKKKNN
ncbi:MAG: CDP-alcohol phosphatidyltransferase family protein [Candidatus Thorarchaeota archaeon]